MVRVPQVAMFLDRVVSALLEDGAADALLLASAELLLPAAAWLLDAAADEGAYELPAADDPGADSETLEADAELIPAADELAMADDPEGA